MGRMPEEMDVGHPKPSSVLVTAKRLDSDEVTETTTKVGSSDSEQEIRRVLSGVVQAVYPDAEFRSFADGAATYLAPKLLVVAVHIPGENVPVRGRDDKDDDSQQRLFAA